MSQAVRSKQDQQFWSVVQDLHWKLDDGSGGTPPEGGEPEFYRGGGGSVAPKWATHVIAFVGGGVSWGSMILAPAALPLIAVSCLIAFVSFAAMRRWR